DPDQPRSGRGPPRRYGTCASFGLRLDCRRIQGLRVSVWSKRLPKDPFPSNLHEFCREYNPARAKVNTPRYKPRIPYGIQYSTGWVPPFPGIAYLNSKIL